MANLPLDQLKIEGYRENISRKRKSDSRVLKDQEKLFQGFLLRYIVDEEKADKWCTNVSIHVIQHNQHRVQEAILVMAEGAEGGYKVSKRQGLEYVGVQCFFFLISIIAFCRMQSRVGFECVVTAPF